MKKKKGFVSKYSKDIENDNGQQIHEASDLSRNPYACQTISSHGK